MENQSYSSETVLVPVSASQQIAGMIKQLMDRCKQDGLQSLSSKDWALLYILNKAQNVISDGRLEFDRLELKSKFIDGFIDEGAKSWRVAFDEALQEACEHYIIPHPDS